MGKVAQTTTHNSARPVYRHELVTWVPYHLNGRCSLVCEELRILEDATTPFPARIDPGTARLAFEDEPCRGATLACLDTDMVTAYRSCCGSDAPTEQMLSEKTFMRDGYLTNAGVLLFAQNPSSFIPCARVHMARFQTFGKATSRHEVCTKDLILDGPLPKLMKQTEDAILDMSVDMTFFDTDGGIKKVEEYPRPAWLDGLMGAIMHRSYRSPSYIHIILSDDQMQILSPGTPSNPQEPTRRTAEGGLRNPRISRSLAEMGITLKNLERETSLTERVTSLEEPSFEALDVLDGKSIKLTLKSNLDAWDQLLKANAVDGRMLLSPIYSL